MFQCLSFQLSHYIADKLYYSNPYLPCNMKSVFSGVYISLLCHSLTKVSALSFVELKENVINDSNAMILYSIIYKPIV